MSFYFNPRSRVGNDGQVPQQLNQCVISIHVPAWGTTVHFCDLAISHFYFNPRSRVGNDEWNQVDNIYSSISIHVPAWGTTRQEDMTTITIYNFNPRSRVGNDAGSSYHHHADSISIHVPAWGTTHAGRRRAKGEKFQSTFPRGERRQRKSTKPRISYFNPRSRVGNDSKFQQFFSYTFV